MTALLSWLFLLLAVLAIAYRRPGREASFALAGLVVGLFAVFGDAGAFAKLLVIAIYGGITVLFNVPFIRRTFVSAPLFAFYKSSMPEISQTERDALEAGTTWWDAQLFTGAPKWKQLLEFPQVSLSDEEREFLEGPVEEFCALLDDYEIDQRTKELPEAAWKLIREYQFFGMVIPKEYGGKGFSQYGHAAVIMKIATRSISAALTVMIPNSVGPGKLLLKYGTDAQKDQYLPKLASAEEIPCFALTAPDAGSDAGALPDTGVVCKQEFHGKETLGIRLNFDKRYITLAPIATVLGLAFKLRDPDGLLGGKDDLGITLALVPSDTPGVEQGRRHDPMHMAFPNGPLRGRDVFIPLDWVIGGKDYVGKGWRMLMESLTDGRAISLPALSTASAKMSARLAGAYSQVRRQFKVPIGAFEGIEEALARIAGNTYTMDAARRVTLAALDEGHKPSVISAIMKYNTTDRARRVVNDAIEIHGGAAVCLGKANPLGQLNSFPAVGVTVEGHNILTRNLITFGQGAIRCHPCLLDELTAAQNEDAEEGARQFDKAITKHVGLSVSNAVRSLLLGLSGARLASVDAPNRDVRSLLQQLTRMSAAFSIATDVLLLTFRGEIKRKERISGRMADVLSQLYLASTAVKHFVDQGAREEDLALLQWSVTDALYTMQQSLDVMLKNLPNRFVSAGLRILLFPLGRRFAPPSDELDHAVAATLQRPGEQRDRLTAGMYMPQDDDDRVVVLERAFNAMLDAAPLEKKLRKGMKSGKVVGWTYEEQLQSAIANDVIGESEAAQLREMEHARQAAIQVDDFASLTGESSE
ncbi:MAG: acyl-CoA dehydrogenase [Gammaproteobacteria bacterium]|nr:acyl-CoA dehydrogenase [Gammaproteobacteria bacterium]